MMFAVKFNVFLLGIKLFFSPNGFILCIHNFTESCITHVYMHSSLVFWTMHSSLCRVKIVTLSTVTDSNNQNNRTTS